MTRTTKEMREVLEEALSIGTSHDRETSRHRTSTQRLMVRAARNVYAAHLVNAIDAKGFVPTHVGAKGREEVKEAASKGQPLTARSYGILLGYSEAYVSRLFRLGFAVEAGVVDPEEKSDGPATRWSILTRGLADTPEVGQVLGKDIDVLPTLDRLDAAMEAAQERRKAERQAKAVAAAQEQPVPFPERPSERLEVLEHLAEMIRHGRHLTPHQIDKVREVMDTLRETIEEWTEAEHKKGAAA